MAEMSDLTSALTKMELKQKSEEEKKSPPTPMEVTHVVGSGAEKRAEKTDESTPSDKEKEKTSVEEQPAQSSTQQSSEPEKEKSPPASEDQQKEEKPSASPPQRKEEKPAASPPPPEDKKKKSPPAQQPMEEDDDILDFTSATEGEGSSSAWEVVPEKKVARKVGVKSDSELDHLLKKLIKEAKEQPLTSSSAAAVTSSSAAASTSSKDLFATIPKDIIAEKNAEQEAGEQAEKEAAEKPVTTEDDVNWQQADFSFEDPPPPLSKESLTSVLGRKNLTAVAEDSDSEMPDVQPASHLGSSSKRKGRSTSQGERALPLKSPRSSSAGPKLKAAPVPKSSNKIPKDREASPQAKAVGKPAAKPPPKAITPLGKAAAAKPPPASVTSKPPPAAASGAKSAPASKGKAPPSAAEREQQAPHSPQLHAVDWSKFTKEAFSARTSEVYRIDPSSAEGYNCHASSYYYVSADWGTSHTQSHSAAMLKKTIAVSHIVGLVSIAEPIAPSLQISRQQKTLSCTGGSITVTPHAGPGAIQPLPSTSPQQRCAKQ